MTDDMLEQLTKPRETFTYIYWFIIQDIVKNTDEQPGKEVHSSRYEKGAQRFHALSGCINLSVPPFIGSSPNPIV